MVQHQICFCVFCIRHVSLPAFFFQAFRKFEEMNGKLAEQLRKLTKQVVYLTLLFLSYCIFTLPVFYFVGLYIRHAFVTGVALWVNSEL